jgi:DNA primase
LEEIGVDVSHEIDTHFICFCPFHINSDSPAFEVNKDNGWFICFNPTCGKQGTSLEELIIALTDDNYFEARRRILKHKQDRRTRRARETEREFAFVPFPQEPVDRMHNALMRNTRALDYVTTRGFFAPTLQYFEIGYSDKQDSIITPMHDPSGMLIGFIARSVEGKEFKNTPGLPKSKTCWNYHRAKRTGDTVIVVESAFDGMRVHQAGYPNVVALLGGGLSRWQEDQLAKTFSTIIIMTDFESELTTRNPCSTCRDEGFMMCQGHRPGRDMGRKIARKLSHKRVLWAAYDETCVYPNEAKDAGDMSDDEIRQCLKNAVSNFAYQRWGVENLNLALA